MNFLLLTGPPAVGKMTVGQEISKRLGYPLFHNHHSIELTLELFPWGTPEFSAINSGIRDLVFKTVANSKNTPGFIFTLVIAFDLEEDMLEVKNIFEQFSSKGWNIYVAELYAPLHIRMERNLTPNRLQHKASKQKTEASAKNLQRMEEKYAMNSDRNLLGIENYLKLDNSLLSASEAATYIIKHFGWQAPV
jgi:dephospho-CoA kinase